MKIKVSLSGQVRRLAGRSNTYHQADSLSFIPRPQSPYGEREEFLLTGCSLTATHAQAKAYTPSNK